jgi:hypothetical protein
MYTVHAHMYLMCIDVCTCVYIHMCFIRIKYMYMVCALTVCVYTVCAHQTAVYGGAAALTGHQQYGDTLDANKADCITQLYAQK